MKISNHHIPFTYQESKRVFENQLPVKEAAENINKKTGIKLTSASDYGYFFKYLITGSGSCRNLNTFTQGYFLGRIFEEFDENQKKKSLHYFKELIEKFEKGKAGSMKSLNEIYEKYTKLV